MPKSLQPYAKSLLPLVVGLFVGTLLLLTGDRETGTTILIATVTTSGIALAVPNRR